jgi:hypothetical protein
MHLHWIQHNGFSKQIVPAEALFHDQHQREILNFNYGAYAGRWAIRYANKGTREYVIDASGGVTFTQEKRGGSLMLGPNRDLILWMGQMERIRLQNGRLQVDHYNPWSNYPFGRVSTTGVGIKK